jgi:hypothetical protein
MLAQSKTLYLSVEGNMIVWFLLAGHVVVARACAITDAEFLQLSPEALGFRDPCSAGGTTLPIVQALHTNFKLFSSAIFERSWGLRYI